MNADTTPDRLQQVADAAIAGNRLMARLELQAAMESRGDDPAVWIWQAWAAGSLQEAEESLQRAAEYCPEHPLIDSGLAWIDGLQQLAAGELEISLQRSDAEPEPSAEPQAPAPPEPPAHPEASAPCDGDAELEADLLASLTAIRDEVFATLYAGQPLEADDPESILRPDPTYRLEAAAGHHSLRR